MWSQKVRLGTTLTALTVRTLWSAKPPIKCSEECLISAVEHGRSCFRFSEYSHQKPEMKWGRLTIFSLEFFVRWILCFYSIQAKNPATLYSYHFISFFYFNFFIHGNPLNNLNAVLLGAMQKENVIITKYTI